MKITIKEMILISLFTALTAIGAFLSIPFGTIHITLQSLFVLLAGLLLGPKLGALSQIVYILLGISGMRIFAGFSGGPQAIFSPSFGFLIGFISAAFIVGKIVHAEKSVNLKKIFFAASIGTIVIYLFGIPYMYMILNFVLNKSISLPSVIKMGCFIFLPGDVLKTIISSLVAFRVIKTVNISKI